MNFSDYLKSIKDVADQDDQKAWFAYLEKRVSQGLDAYHDLDDDGRLALQAEFQNRVRTEELKAWYGSPEGESLFQGTSVSSLTIPAEFSAPMDLTDIGQLEEAMADSYIELHNRHEDKVRGAIIEDVEDWIGAGLYFGVAIASKVISQAFQLFVPAKDVVFKVDDFLVDPHEIISYPEEVREEYFHLVRERLTCFGEVDIEQEEMEASLILADISKPRIERFKDNIFLAPIRANEVACVMARNIRGLIEEKTGGRITPPSLAVVILDTDTPYTYHHLIGGNANPLAPALPGLTVLGSSGTIEAFRWLYTYRVSLIFQKIAKGSLYSQVHKRFIPYVFYGVLVPRDAEILLDMNQLDLLRYRGNLSPQIEFCYLIPQILHYLTKDREDVFWDSFKRRLV